MQAEFDAFTGGLQRSPMMGMQNYDAEQRGQPGRHISPQSDYDQKVHRIAIDRAVQDLRHKMQDDMAQDQHDLQRGDFGNMGPPVRPVVSSLRRHENQPVVSEELVGLEAAWPAQTRQPPQSQRPHDEQQSWAQEYTMSGAGPTVHETQLQLSARQQRQGMRMAGQDPDIIQFQDQARDLGVEAARQDYGMQMNHSGLATARQDEQNQTPGPRGAALADYEMQLMLLEEQNKRRLMMARQEQMSMPPQNEHPQQIVDDLQAQWDTIDMHCRRIEAQEQEEIQRHQSISSQGVQTSQDVQRHLSLLQQYKSQKLMYASMQSELEEKLEAEDRAQEISDDHIWATAPQGDVAAATASDGADVLALLDDPAMLTSAADHDTELADSADVSADDLFPQARVASTDPQVFRPRFVSPPLQRPHLSTSSATTTTDTANLLPTLHTSPGADFADKTLWLRDWARVLTSYADDVWDPASFPWVQEAREVMQEVNALHDGHGGEEGKQGDEARERALRRLRMTLAHVRVPEEVGSKAVDTGADVDAQAAALLHEEDEVRTSFSRMHAQREGQVWHNSNVWTGDAVAGEQEAEAGAKSKGADSMYAKPV